MKSLKKILAAFIAAATLMSVAAFAVACGEPDDDGGKGNNGEKATVTSISLALEASNTKYISGDVFDPSGISLRVTYSDGKSENITTGFTYDTEPLEVGDTSVTITYEGKTVEQPVSVSDAADALIVCFYSVTTSGDKTRCYGDGTVVCGGSQIDPYFFNDADDSSLANLTLDKSMLSAAYDIGTWSWDGENFTLVIEDTDVGATYNEETGVWVMNDYDFGGYTFNGSCTEEQAEKYLTADRTWPVERAE